MQHLIRAKDMMFDDEILQVTFNGTNIHLTAKCRCHHPILTDDGATACVFIPIPQWHLQFKYALSLNRN